MRGEYQTRQKREMTRFLAEHAMQGFTPEELGTLMRLQKKMLANLADTEVHSILEG